MILKNKNGIELRKKYKTKQTSVRHFNALNCKGILLNC